MIVSIIGVNAWAGIMAILIVDDVDLDLAILSELIGKMQPDVVQHTS